MPINTNFCGQDVVIFFAGLNAFQDSEISDKVFKKDPDEVRNQNAFGRCFFFCRLMVVLDLLCKLKTEILQKQKKLRIIVLQWRSF